MTVSPTSIISTSREATLSRPRCPGQPNVLLPSELTGADFSGEKMDPFEKKLRETIASLSYKSWTFRLEKDGIGLWFLQVVVAGPDAKTNEPITWSGRKWRMSGYMTVSEIVTTALKAVLTAEEHEAREHFLYKGRAIFGPHLNVENLWHLAGDEDGTEHRESR